MKENSIEEKILTWKAELELEKENKSKLEGELSAVTKQLQEEFGVTTPQEIEARIASLEQSDQNLTDQLNQGVKDYEEKYA